MDAIRIVSSILYLGCLLFYLYSFKHLLETKEKNKYSTEQLVHLPGGYRYMWRYDKSFFTNWTYVLQIFFVSIAILDELTKLLGLPSALQKLLGKSRAFIFNAVLFPCTLIVLATFWSLWHIDRELIFPKAVDEFFPSWLNHVLHTFIIIPVCIELLLPKKDNFISFKVAAPSLLVYCVVYQALYFTIYFRDGVWLYPVYKVLNWPQRALFNLLQVSLLLGFQFIGIKIQNSKNPNPGLKKVK